MPSNIKFHGRNAWGFFFVIPSVYILCLLIRSSDALLYPINPASYLKRFPTARNMFSGIIEDIGSVDRYEVVNDLVLWDGSKGEGVEMTIKCPLALSEAYIGCSIAVNGVCLTATELNSDSSTFRVGLAPETLRRSNLSKLKKGDKVNIERALRTDSRNSGHFVQGHVDCEGVIDSMRQEGDSLWITLKVPSHIIRYMVPKGFVALDGTSLTICDVNHQDNTFSVMLVRHTQERIIFPLKKPGDTVNVEVDVLAKMMDNMSAGLVEKVKYLEGKVAELEQKLNALPK